MGAPVEITRTDLSAAELRMAAAATRDAPVARRLLALALVVEGTDRASAARVCGMDRQTLRDWLHRYNQEGIEGLNNRPLSGRPSRLTAAQREIVAGWIGSVRLCASKYRRCFGEDAVAAQAACRMASTATVRRRN